MAGVAGRSGGARPGSGRKPHPEPLGDPKPIKFTKKQMDHLQKMAQEERKSISDYVRDLVDADMGSQAENDLRI
jgi:hypothetical protein